MRGIFNIIASKFVIPFWAMLLANKTNEATNPIRAIAPQKSPNADRNALNAMARIIKRPSICQKVNRVDITPNLEEKKKPVPNGAGQI